MRIFVYLEVLSRYVLLNFIGLMSIHDYISEIDIVLSLLLSRGKISNKKSLLFHINNIRRSHIRVEKKIQTKIMVILNLMLSVQCLSK